MALVGGLEVAMHLPVVGAEGLARCSLPDLIATKRQTKARALVKLVNWSGIPAARALPDSRSLLIMRHPCAQVDYECCVVPRNPCGQVHDDWLKPIAYAALQRH